MNLSLLIENVQRICEKKGLKPTNVCLESGAGKDFIANAKKGMVPSVAKVQLLADYLGVTTSELLGEKKAPADISLGELEFALLGEVHDLTEEEKQELLRNAKRMNELRRLKKEGK